MWPWLIDTDSFVRRTQCGDGWSNLLIFTHQICEVNIALAYYAVAALLAWYLHRRRDRFAYRGVVWIYVAFIAACGVTHMMGFLMFHWPFYRLAAASLMICAALANAAIVATFYWSKMASEDIVIPGVTPFGERIKQLRKWAEQIEGNMNAAGT